MTQAVVVDTVLHNRMIQSIGMAAYTRCTSATVAIVGLKGIGVEVAKNIILTGVRSVTLVDNESVSWDDLSDTYCARSEHVGLSRAESYQPHLAELNPTVHIAAVKWSSDDIEKFDNFTAVVAVNQQDVRRLGDYCHEKGIFFVLAEGYGLFSRVFTDFGANFVVESPFANDPIRHLVTQTEFTEDGVIIISVDDSDKKMLGLAEGDAIRFEAFDAAASALNGKTVVVKKVLKAFASLEKPGLKFSIEENLDVRTVGAAIIQGGYVVEVHMPQKMTFESLGSQQGLDANFAMDFVRNVQDIHACFSAMHQFVGLERHFPRAYNSEDADTLITFAKQLKPDVCEADARVFSHTCGGTLGPISTYVGGVASQEVLKAITRKYVPISQWYYFDVRELYDGSISEADAARRNSRYDGQIAIVGKAMQDRLEALNLFVVGSGALGCEYVKALSLMGAGCSKRGLISITDDDPIERGNLSRQFLFRNEHIGKMKATIAAQSAKKINPTANFRVLLKKVKQETEDIFNGRFWSKQALIINALDNIAARLYVDSKCVQHQKILIEAGTTGPKANMLMVVPKVTPSYAEGNTDTDTGVIPACTVHFYPTTIEHCIHYAKDLFVGEFRNCANEVNAYVHSPESWIKNASMQPATMFPSVSGVHYTHVFRRPKSALECFQLSRLAFEQTFVNNIKQLLHTYPADLIEKKTGKPYWSGFRKVPRLIAFDVSNSQHTNFVRLNAKFLAELYGIEPINMKDDHELCRIIESVAIPPFSPRDDAVIPSEAEESTTKGEEKKMETAAAPVDRSADIAAMLDEMKAAPAVPLTPIEFEKDDPTNGHVEFLACIANIRAGCYGIPPADVMTVQRVSGNIIPAMVTTTAIIVGAGSLELYKAVRYLAADEGTRQVLRERFRNAFVDLSAPFFLFSECNMCKQIKYLTKEPTSGGAHPLAGKTFTIWDRFEIRAQGDISLSDFLEAFEQKYTLQVVQVFMMQSQQRVWIFNRNDAEGMTSRMSWPLGRFVAKLLDIEVQEVSAQGVEFLVSCTVEGGEVSEKLPLCWYGFNS